ncbi:MAG: putative zinc protease [Phycisphaerae bacterium]|nr:putative zinc protease [Phycisphaerae bacterium]
MDVCRHEVLSNGIEWAALNLPDRKTITGELRFLTGFVHEPATQLGINHLVEQTIDKGTTRRTGHELHDAFDALGARWASWSGREATGFQITALPEYFDAALALVAEFLLMPTFPTEAVDVAIQNTLDEITHLDDDPQELTSKLFHRRVYGPVLGRHLYGEADELRGVTSAQVENFWRTHYVPGRMQASFAGPLDANRLAASLEKLFPAQGAITGRERLTFDFQPGYHHQSKELEQEHIAICYPGASLDHPQRFAQRVLIAVLSGGMSCRLFTEVREKQGLVYWVTAYTEHPRGVGMVYLGASSTPQRCPQTYTTLIREIERVREDLQADEVQRAITGLVARMQTRGDITAARCAELADDLFHYGRIIPREEKINQISRVTVNDVQAYLQAHPPTPRQVLTLGPDPITLESS